MMPNTIGSLHTGETMRLDIACTWVIKSPATTAPPTDHMPPTITTVKARKIRSRPMVGNTE